MSYCLAAPSQGGFICSLSPPLLSPWPVSALFRPGETRLPVLGPVFTLFGSAEPYLPVSGPVYALFRPTKPNLPVSWTVSILFGPTEPYLPVSGPVSALFRPAKTRLPLPGLVYILFGPEWRNSGVENADKTGKGHILRPKVEGCGKKHGGQREKSAEGASFDRR